MLRHLVPTFALLLLPSVGFADTLTGSIGDPGLRRKVELVYLEQVPGKFPATPASMNQKGNTFLPHVLPVVVNSEVKFMSEDEELHNVFARGGKKVLFNQAQLPKQLFNKTFNELGPVHLTCNIHKEMNAWVLVLQNPFFATPDAKGAFSLSNVPAGNYTLRIWGEKLDESDAAKKFPVTVGPGSAPLLVAGR